MQEWEWYDGVREQISWLKLITTDKDVGVGEFNILTWHSSHSLAREGQTILSESETLIKSHHLCTLAVFHFSSFSSLDLAFTFTVFGWICD